MSYSSTLRLRSKCDISLDSLAETAKKQINSLIKELESEMETFKQTKTERYRYYKSTLQRLNKEIKDNKKSLEVLLNPKHKEYINTISDTLWKYGIEYDNGWFFSKKEDCFGWEIYKEFDNIKKIPTFTTYEEFKHFVENNRESEENNTKQVSDKTMARLENYWALYPYSVLSIW